jgi:hypothetical protein
MVGYDLLHLKKVKLDCLENLSLAGLKRT